MKHPQPNNLDRVICGMAVIRGSGGEGFDLHGRVEVVVKFSGKSRGKVCIAPVPLKEKDSMRAFGLKQIEVAPFKSMTVGINDELTTYKITFETQKGYIRFLCAIEKANSKRSMSMMDLILNYKIKSRKRCLNALYKYITPFKLEIESLERTNKALFDVLFSSDKILEMEHLLWTNNSIEISVPAYVIYRICSEHKFIPDELIPRYFERRGSKTLFTLISDKFKDNKIEDNRDLCNLIREYIWLLFCSNDRDIISYFYDIKNILTLSIIFENSQSYAEAQKELPFKYSSEAEKQLINDSIKAMRIAADYPKLIPLDTGDVVTTSICNQCFSSLVKDVISLVQPHFPEVISIGKNSINNSESFENEIFLIQFYEELMSLFFSADVSLSPPVYKNSVVNIIDPKIVHHILSHILENVKEFDINQMSLIEKLLSRFINHKLYNMENSLDLAVKTFMYCVKQEGDDVKWITLSKALAMDIISALESRTDICRFFIDNDAVPLALALNDVKDIRNIPLIISVLCVAAKIERGRMLDTLGDSIQIVFSYITQEEPFDVAPMALQFWVTLATIPKLSEELLKFTGPVVQAVCKIERNGGIYTPKMRTMFRSVQNASIGVTVPPSQEDNANWLVGQSKSYQILKPPRQKVYSKKKRLKHFDVATKRTE